MNGLQLKFGNLVPGPLAEPNVWASGWAALLEKIQESQGLVAMLVVAILAWTTALVLYRRSLRVKEAGTLGRQWVWVMTVIVVFLFVLLLLPIDAETKGQIVQVLGVVLPAGIALSSTALLGNALGGLVLQRTANFQLGDFIEVGDHFGRISERTLMNTEIQTADRDFITLPNLMLVTQPVKVVRRTGTVVSATVSLGYDVPWEKVESALKEAASLAELTDPFVQVMELGDFSVVYRAAGICSDVRSVLTVRANLRLHMLDCLHGSDVEVLSPAFINMRGISEHAPASVPGPKPSGSRMPGGKGMAAPPTDLIFDKADTAQAMIGKRKELEEVQLLLTEAKEENKKTLEVREERLKAHIAYLEGLIEKDVE